MLIFWRKSKTCASFKLGLLEFNVSFRTTGPHHHHGHHLLLGHHHHRGRRLFQRLQSDVGNIRFHQCDQIGRIIALWAAFKSLWQQLFCPNRVTFLGKFYKGVKIFHFSSEIILGNFLRYLATFYWSHWISPSIYRVNKSMLRQSNWFPLCRVIQIEDQFKKIFFCNI